MFILQNAIPLLVLLTFWIFVVWAIAAIIRSLKGIERSLQVIARTLKTR